jgi:hypothetical protein
MQDVHRDIGLSIAFASDHDARERDAKGESEKSQTV